MCVSSKRDEQRGRGGFGTLPVRERRAARGPPHGDQVRWQLVSDFEAVKGGRWLVKFIIILLLARRERITPEA